MKIFCSGCTNGGNRFGINQDSIGIFTDGNKGMFVIADGMGHSELGYQASQKVVETVQSCWNYWKKTKVPFVVMIHKIKMLLEENNRLFIKETDEKLTAGSTFVILVVSKAKIGMFSVGDSRIYMKRQNLAFQVTPDDVWDNLYEVKSSMSKEEILKNENHGKLTQVFGMNPTLDLHYQTMGTYQGAKFILASDGIYQYCPKMLLDESICKMNTLENQEIQLRRVCEEVQKNGAHDNFSIICVTMEK